VKLRERIQRRLEREAAGRPDRLARRQRRLRAAATLKREAERMSYLRRLHIEVKAQLEAEPKRYRATPAQLAGLRKARARLAQIREERKHR
jgi:hypothetical protein